MVHLTSSADSSSSWALVVTPGPLAAVHTLMKLHSYSSPSTYFALVAILYISLFFDFKGILPYSFSSYFEELLQIMSFCGMLVARWRLWFGFCFRLAARMMLSWLRQLLIVSKGLSSYSLFWSCFCCRASLPLRAWDHICRNFRLFSNQSFAWWISSLFLTGHSLAFSCASFDLLLALLLHSLD